MEYILYKDAAGYWRWRLKATNGKIIADSAEGYVSKADAEHGIALTKSSYSAPVRQLNVA